MSSWREDLLKFTQMEVRDNASVPECKVISTVGVEEKGHRSLRLFGQGAPEASQYVGIDQEDFRRGSRLF